MPETDTIPVSASIASTGLGIRYIGDHVYAYSGVISVNDNETTLLSFNSGKGYIKAQVQFNYISNANQDFTYKIYFNNIVIQQYNVGNSVIYTSPDNFINIIIPPLSDVRLSAQNISDSTALNQIGSLIGRVYGAA